MAATNKLEVIEGGKGEPAAPKRTLPKRIATIPLADDYADFSITAWMNYPPSVRKDLRSGDEERTLQALQQIVLESDLVDFDGTSYPSPQTKAFWEQVPDDVAAYIVIAVQSNLGKSAPPTGAR